MSTCVCAVYFYHAEALELHSNKRKAPLLIMIPFTNCVCVYVFVGQPFSKLRILLGIKLVTRVTLTGVASISIDAFVFSAASILRSTFIDFQTLCFVAVLFEASITVAFETK